MSLTGGTKPGLAGVVGWPVTHSLSPRLHAYWLARLGIEGHYVPLPVRPENLERAITALPALGFRGVNVTVPHKEAVCSLIDRVEPAAARIRAVNTILIRNDGRLEGRNTDAYGLLANLDQQVPRWREQAQTALLLGAGGAARAGAVALLDAGLARIHIVNRTKARAEALADDLGDGRLVPAGWQDRSSLLKDTDLIINTTTLGMTGYPPLDLNLSLLPRHAIVYDIVYRPLETALLRQAKARGFSVVDGLGMLIHQAVPAFETFYGHQPQVDSAAKAHLLEVLAEP